MSVYQYRAYNAAGQTVSGVLEADGLLTVETRLRNIGLWLLDAKESEGAVTVERRLSGSAPTHWESNLESVR